jgi:hypothetical protein
LADRDQLRRELAFLEARIADTQEHITKSRDKINAQENSGRKAEYETTILEACELLLYLQIGIQERLKQRLTTPQR